MGVTKQPLSRRSRRCPTQSRYSDWLEPPHHFGVSVQVPVLRRLYVVLQFFHGLASTDKAPPRRRKVATAPIFSLLFSPRGETHCSRGNTAPDGMSGRARAFRIRSAASGTKGESQYATQRMSLSHSRRSASSVSASPDLSSSQGRVSSIRRFSPTTTDRSAPIASS